MNDRIDLPPEVADFGIAPGTHAKLIAAIEAVPAIDRVWIFGSRARGSQRPESDIDLALEARGDPLSAMAALSQRIEAAGLMYRVDLVALNRSLDESFRAIIQRDRRMRSEEHTSELQSR